MERQQTGKAAADEIILNSRQVLGLLDQMGHMRRMNALAEAIKKVSANGRVGHFVPTGGLLLIKNGPQGYEYPICHEDPTVQAVTCELVQKLLSGEKVECRLVIES